MLNIFALYFLVHKTDHKLWRKIDKQLSVRTIYRTVLYFLIVSYNAAGQLAEDACA